MEVQPGSGIPHEHGLLWRRLTSTQRSLLTALQSGKCSHLTMAALKPIVKLGLAAVTVSLRPEDLREQFPTMGEELVAEVVALELRLQVHSCTESCMPVAAGLQLCRHYYPKPPSLLPLVARRPLLETEEQEEKLGRLEAVGHKVQKLVRGGEVERWGEEPVPSLLQLLRGVAPAPIDFPGIGCYWSSVMFPWEEELASLLDVFLPMTTSREDALLLSVYHASLLLRRHPRYIPVRRVSEAWVVGSNPWALVATQANMEADLVVATPSSLTSYMTKGAGQHSLWKALRELERRGEEQDLAMAAAVEEAIKAGYREVPLAEALYRLDSRLHYTCSSHAGVVRVSARLGARGEVEESVEKERYGMRPPGLELLTLAQFLLWYRLPNLGQEEARPQERIPISLIKTGDTPWAPHHITILPTILTLEDGTVLRRMRQPRALHVSPATPYSTILLCKVPKTFI